MNPPDTAVVSISAALSFARDRIEAIDARLLLQHASGLGHAQLAAYPERELEAQVWRSFEALVARRTAGEPIAYLIGWREFYGRRFQVTPDVLIPRPETELLIDRVLQSIDKAKPLRILDLGTGSGVLAITLALELPDADITAIDVSLAALDVASRNAECLGARVRFIESDWYSALGGERFDTIVSNPPYVAPADSHLDQGDLRFEPRTALVGHGAAGAGDVERIVHGAPTHLNRSGRLYVEHGWDQGALVQGFLNAAGFDGIATINDLGGNARVTLGSLPIHDRPNAG